MRKEPSPSCAREVTRVTVEAITSSWNLENDVRAEKCLLRKLRPWASVLKPQNKKMSRRFGEKYPRIDETMFFWRHNDYVQYSGLLGTKVLVTVNPGLTHT